MKTNILQFSPKTQLSRFFKCSFFYVLLFWLLPVASRAQTQDTAVIRQQIDTLIRRGLVKRDAKLYDTAFVYLSQALALQKQAFGVENKRGGHIFFQMGICRYFVGNNNEAIDFFQKSADIRIKLPGAYDNDLENTYRNLTVTLYQTQQFLKAVAPAETLIEISAKLYGKESLKYAINLHLLGVIYLQNGLYDESEKLFRETLSLKEKFLEPDDPQIEVSVNALASAFLKKGQYENAEILYQSILGTSNIDSLQNINENELNVISNLGVLYLETSRLELAESMFQKVAEFTAAKYGKNGLEYGEALEKLAIIDFYKMNYEKAIETLKVALAIAEKLNPTQDKNYFQSINNLLGYTVEANLTAESERLVGILVPELKADNPEMATLKSTIANNLAVYYFNNDSLDLALQYAKFALKERDLTYGPDHIMSMGTLTNIILLYDFSQLFDSCNILLKKAIPLAQQNLLDAASYLSEGELSGQLERSQALQNKFLSILTRAPEVIDKAQLYENTLFLKSFQLDQNSQMRNVFQHGSDLLKGTFHYWQQYKFQIGREFSKPAGQRKDLTYLQAVADSLEKILVHNSAFKSDRYAPLHWQDVRNTLKTGEAAIEFVSFQYFNVKASDSTFYAAFIITPESSEPVYKVLFEEKQLTALLQRKTQVPEMDIQNLYFSETNASASPLYALIWEPLMPYLSGVDHIYLSNAGLLNQINPSAIHVAKRKNLSDQFQFTALNSTRHLVTDTDTRSQARQAVLFGKIDYEMDSLRYGNALNALSFSPEKNIGAALGSVQSIPGRLRSGTENAPWPSLRSTEGEINAVAQALQNAHYSLRVYKNLEATEEAFKRIGVEEPSPNIIHICTHGFYFPGKVSKQSVFSMQEDQQINQLDQPLYRSGLVLAGANYAWCKKRPMGHFEDGILTAYEISNMNLTATDLVVLSACETGLGEVRGYEGVYGLQRAFKAAGAKHLLMSLWPVPDAETQQLMTAFYRFYQEEKLPVDRALAAAQQELRAKHANPYFWAGFVLLN